MKKLSDLPIGAKVKDLETKYLGAVVIWEILDKNHAGYPVGTTTLLTRDIIGCKAWDAVEDWDAGQMGYNRYAFSNIRQWMNSAQVNWYTPQHSLDQPPARNRLLSICTSDLHAAYDSEPGFLTNFSEGFKRNLVVTPIESRHSSIGLEVLHDKLWLLSWQEVAPADGQEGHQCPSGWEEGTVFPKFLAGSSSRGAYLTQQAYDWLGWYGGWLYSPSEMYPELRIGANKLWFWNLRTQDPFYGYNGDGGITHIDLRDDPNYLEVTPSDEDDSAHSPYFGFRPACNLPSEVGVLDNPDTDGVYILQWWTPPQIFVDINDSIYQYVNGWVMMDDTHSDLREIDSIVAKEGDTLWQS